ncbi:MAG: flagellar protein FlgN [Methylococcales bacterium]|nr:flagellar protein FlgN [Methylococcales bacterium]MDD5753551.1 flagellar protein FlgN [Methylococcales bacterium]
MIEHTFPIAEQLMTNALQLTQRLYQQLNQEADCLIRTPQSDFISAVANNKRDLVAQLDLFNKQLEQILAAEQLPHSQIGINTYFQMAIIANLSPDTLKANWEQLMKLCADCKHLNEQNGASIEMLARNNKRTLHILKGKSENVTSYGRDGSTISEFQNSTLVSV